MTDDFDEMSDGEYCGVLVVKSELVDDGLHGLEVSGEVVGEGEGGGGLKGRGGDGKVGLGLGLLLWGLKGGVEGGGS